MLLYDPNPLVLSFKCMHFFIFLGVLHWLTVVHWSKHERKRKQRKWHIWRVWWSLDCLPLLVPSSHNALWISLRSTFHLFDFDAFIFCCVHTFSCTPLKFHHIVSTGGPGEGVQLCNHQHLWDTGVWENGGRHVQSCSQSETCQFRTGFW